MKRFIISILTFVSFTGVFAQLPIFDVDGIYFRLLEDTTGTSPNGMIAAVTTMGDLDHYKGSVSIPATITRNGIDYSVTTITEMAFRGCSGLTSISIPASVTHIPSGAFYGCSGLKTITVAPSNTRYDSRDNCNAVIETATNTIVASCNASVIPESVPNIGECAFWGSKQMKELTISSDLRKIGQWAFLDCGDIETLYWNNPYYSPQTVTAYIYPSLKHVVLGDSVTRIYSGAFAGCSNLESIVLPSGLENIDQNAFYGCTSLKSISIPQGVNNIDYNAFQGCSGLETLYWNYWDSTAISRLFASSKESLKNLIIGDAVTHIEGRAFDGFTNLQSIKVDPANKVYDSRDCNGVVETASNTLVLGCKTTTVPEGITGIGEYAFKWCSGPASFNLPSTLLRIGSYAFTGCDSLTTLTIPENVNYIGYGITAYCNNLVSLKVASGNQYFDSREDCNSIIQKSSATLLSGCSKSVVPSGVKAIGESAFEGIQTLNAISLPSTVQEIGALAFAGCSSLKSLSIPNGVKRIETGLVIWCTNLESIDIPSSVNYIENSAFNDCSSLKSLVIPEGVTSIDNMFRGCESLSYVSLPSTARIEWDKAPFSGIPGLKSAGPKGGGYNLEFSWDTIPGCVFNDMVNLESVCIPKQVKLINDQNLSYSYWYDSHNRNIYRASYFAGCDNLESLAISFSDTKIMRRFSPDSRYKYEAPADNYLLSGTPIHSIIFLDDTIKSLNVIDGAYIDEIVISEQVKEIAPKAFVQPNYLIDIEVEKGNAKYSSFGGVLFNKDLSELIAFPMWRFQQEYFVPNDVTKIGDYAFSGARINSVTITQNVEKIGTRAFENCKYLESVLIKGDPEIGHNAFIGSHYIESVTSLSSTPGKMNVYDAAQTIKVGEYGSINQQGFIIDREYSQELDRNVSLISYPGIKDWNLSITTTDIPAGKYKVTMGILPSPEDMPNYLHPIIRCITDSIDVVLIDSAYIIEQEILPGMTIQQNVLYYMINDMSGYDTLLIADIVDIPEDNQGIQITLQSGVNERNSSKYSSVLLLDGIYFEPLGDNIPQEKYAGPFTESVFNNATLYVPNGAVEAYRNADGWKLFKSIAVDTKTYPSEELEVNVTSAGYATFYYGDADYILPSGISAMVVSNLTADGKLVYTTIADGTDKGVVPAHVPVILATDDGEAGSFKLQYAGRGAYYEGGNLLMGTDVDTLTYAEENSWFYKLSLGPTGSDLSDVPGWYWAAANGGAFQIEAHKAWLAIPKSMTTRSSGYSLDGDPTGLIEIRADAVDNEPVMYDLYGRRIDTPVNQGLMIINGKKVYIMK